MKSFLGKIGVTRNLIALFYIIVFLLLIISPKLGDNEPRFFVNEFVEKIENSKGKEDWLYESSSGEIKKGNLPVFFTVERGKTVHFFKNFRQIYPRKDYCLAFYTDCSNVEVYAGESLIYSYSLPERHPYKNDKTMWWHVVSLDEKNFYSNMRILYRYTGEEEVSSVYSLDNVIFGNRSEIYFYFIWNSINVIIWSIFVIGFLLSAMLIYQIVLKSKYNKKKPLYLIEFSLITLCLSLMNTSIIYILPYYSNIGHYLLFICSALSPLPVLFYIRENKYYTYRAYLTIPINIVFVIAIVLNISIILNFITLHMALRIAICVFIAVMVGLIISLLIILVKQKNKTRQLSVVFVGFLLSTLFMANDGIMYLTSSKHSNFYGLLIGSLIFIFQAFYDSVMDAVKYVKDGQRAIFYRGLSVKDNMTGLDNYNSYMIKMESLEERNNDLDSIGIIMIDMNNLKVINDTYGHSMGDEAINIVSKTLKKISNERYRCYRVGGDEFLVVATKTDIEEIEDYIKDINVYIRKFSEWYEFDLTVSIGYAIYDENIDKSLYDTEKRADSMMYGKKKSFKTSISKEITTDED